MVQLIVRYNHLYYPGDPKRDSAAVEPGAAVPVLCVYPEGDCDQISWPFRSDKDCNNLKTALFDDRERGLIADEEVLLPDGSSAWKARYYLRDDNGEIIPASDLGADDRQAELDYEKMCDRAQRG